MTWIRSSASSFTDVGDQKYVRVWWDSLQTSPPRNVRSGSSSAADRACASSTFASRNDWAQGDVVASAPRLRDRVCLWGQYTPRGQGDGAEAGLVAARAGGMAGE